MPRHNDYLSRHLRDMAPHRAILRSVECLFMSRIPLVGPVLDIGCGDGHFASIAYTVPIAIGIDLQRRDLAEAAQRRPHVYHDLAVASATIMPFADDTFGTVVSNCVLEHIPDLDAALGEISRVLQPGGTFAITLPSEYFPRYLLGATFLRRLQLPALADRYGTFFNTISHHHHVYPPPIWHARLASVGLELVEHRYYFSAAAHRAFDLAHYLGLPNLIAKRLLGRWVLSPRLMLPFDRWLRPYYEEPLPIRGAYQFLRCTKVAR